MEKRKIECIPKCLIVSFKRKSHSVKGISGEELFQRFSKINSRLYWNLDLKEVFDNCEYLGYVKPYSVLLRTTDIFIQSIRLAHEKRLLKAPDGFSISFVGDIDTVHCQSVQPSQFVSLDEALCYIIYELNLRAESSSFELICTRLAEWYSGLQLPPQSLILATLRSLLDAGQVYYTGYGYNILTKDKVLVAQWLKEQSTNKKRLDTPSISTSDLSTNDCGQNVSSSSYCKEPDTQIYSNAKLPLHKSMDTVHLINYSKFNPPALYMATDPSVKKKIKSRSAVRQFLSKLRPHKFSRTRSSTETSTGASSYYPPGTITTTMSSGLVLNDAEDDPETYYPSANSVQLPRPTQWLWHTSLQSLPIPTASNQPQVINNSASTISMNSCRRSVSSHSRLSTQAIHDDSPPMKSGKFGRKHSSSSKHRRHKEKQSVEPDIGLPDDSGIHSVSGSQSRVPSFDIPRSNHRYFRSLELDHSMTGPDTKAALEVDLSSLELSKSYNHDQHHYRHHRHSNSNSNSNNNKNKSNHDKYNDLLTETSTSKHSGRHQLSRSFSTRLSSISGTGQYHSSTLGTRSTQGAILDPVYEHGRRSNSDRINSHNNRHVFFQDT